MNWTRIKILLKFFLVGTILLPVYFYYTASKVQPCDQIKPNFCHISNHCILKNDQCQSLPLWRYIVNKLPYSEFWGQNL